MIDEIIPEPLGGAHQDPGKAGATLKQSLLKELKALNQLSEEDLLQKRYEKFRKMGIFEVASEEEKKKGTVR